MDFFIVPAKAVIGTKSIGSKAFAACRYMIQIRIPNSVTDIADDAFNGIENNIVILCEENSAAKRFAVDHFIEYKIINANE